MTLGGGGHAPFMFYLPLLILWGPLFLVGQVMQFGNSNVWSSAAIMVQDLALPGLVYPFYTAVVGLSPLAWRWRALKLLVIGHLAGAVVSAFALFLQ